MITFFRRIGDAFRTFWNILIDGKSRDKLLAWLLVVLFALFVGRTIYSSVSPEAERYVPTSDFVYQLDHGNVAELHISNIDGTVNGKYKTPADDGTTKFSSHVPERSETFAEKYLQTGDIQYDYSKTPGWVSTLTSIFMFILQLAAFAFLFMVLLKMQTSDSDSVLGIFGDDDDDAFSTDIPDTTFDDVAGIPEAIEEVSEIVTFLKNPEVYDEAGAECPRGILLEGSPGCGKTLLARALAGEAGVKFIAASGSDFVKLYVGNGAKRVRELFSKARKASPAIIFIDEIDAIGGKRDAGGGKHDEHLQTINALLKEMDGFKKNSRVIVVAATNRLESLDPALVRPGRFDRIITVDTPAKEGRRAILEHYAQGRPFAQKIDFDKLAAHTYGFSGAELANVMNQAATLAARRATAEHKDPAITDADLEEGISRVMSGPAMKSKKLDDDEKRCVAYHEAGHAIVQYLLPECDPVQKISIVSRRMPNSGVALGYVQSYPEKESYMTTSAKLNAELAALMAGRCSEDIYCGIESAGAYDDLQKASKYAYDMVDKYAFRAPSGEQKSWRVEVRDKSGLVKASQRHLEEIDDQVDCILNKAYDTAKRIVSQHRPEINSIVDVLLEEETIDSERIKTIIDGEHEEASE